MHTQGIERSVDFDDFQDIRDFDIVTVGTASGLSSFFRPEVMCDAHCKTDECAETCTDGISHGIGFTELLQKQRHDEQ